MNRFPHYLLISVLAWSALGPLGLIAQTQEPLPPEATPSAEPAQMVPSHPATQLAQKEILMKVGRGDLQQFEDTVSRVSVSDPEIADAVVVSPHDVVINARIPGVTTAM